MELIYILKTLISSTTNVWAYKMLWPIKQKCQSDILKPVLAIITIYNTN